MSVVKGLPEELRMNAVSLPDSVSSYSVKVAPQNLSSITSSNLSIAAASFASGTVTEITMPSTQINFDVPVSGSPNTWIDTAKSTISFRARYRRIEGGTAIGSNIRANLRGCAWNFFDRIFHVSASGTIIDDVNLCGLAHQNDLNMNLSAQELDSLALAYGFNAETTVGATTSTNANTGHSITNFVGSKSASDDSSSYYSYEFPLPSSVIGKFCRGMFPIGKCSKLTLSLVTNVVAPVTVESTGSPTASGSTTLSIVIDNIALNLQYVDLGIEGSRLLGDGNTSIVNGITHRVSSGTINASTTGAVSMLCGIRGSSVRSLYTRFVDGGSTSTSVSANNYFDSKMPLASSINYFLQGKHRIPPNPLNLINAPASAYMRALQASNAFNDRAYKMNSTPQSYCIYTAGTLPSASDAYLTSSSTESRSLSTFVFGMPLQKVSKSRILDGMNFNNSNQFLEVNLQASNTNALGVYFIAELDVIYIIDGSGDIQTRI